MRAMTMRRAAVALTVTGLFAVTPFAANAEIRDFEFRLVKAEMKKGDAEVAVRLVNKKTGKPVPDAVIFAKRIDMAPDGMADHGGADRATAVDRAGRLSLQDRAFDAGSLAALARREGPGRERLGREQAGRQGAAMRRALRVLADPRRRVDGGDRRLWLGHRDDLGGFAALGQTVARDTAQTPSGPVIYYQDPDGKPLYSRRTRADAGRPALPRGACERRRQLRPKTAGEAASPPGAEKFATTAIRWDLPDVSKMPKKDSDGDGLHPRLRRRRRRWLDRSRCRPASCSASASRPRPPSAARSRVPVRAPGTIQLDERRIAVISLRSEAFIDTRRKRHDRNRGARRPAADAALQPADRRGGLGLRHVARPQERRQDAARRQAAASESRVPRRRCSTRSSAPARSRSPSPGRPRATASCLSATSCRACGSCRATCCSASPIISSVWAMVDVAERDLGARRRGPVGHRARAQLSGPDLPRQGRAGLSAPQSGDPHGARADRASQPRLAPPARHVRRGRDRDRRRRSRCSPCPTAPSSTAATGRSCIVDKGEGRFEPRPVRLGRRGAGYVEIRDGIAEGDVVVTSANFLIDAESNLKAALKTMTEAGAPQ